MNLSKMSAQTENKKLNVVMLPTV